MQKFFKGFDYEKTPLFARRFINSFLAFFLFKRSFRKMKIIAVTGTCGKTTTSTLLYQIATALGYKAGLIGSIENFIGNKKISSDFYREGFSGLCNKIFYSSTSACREVWELYKLLKEMQQQSCEYVFIETTSHGLEEKRVARLKFAGGIFTNLSHEHLDFHKTMQNYFLAKRKLFQMLPSESFALSNIDDERGLAMMENIKARKFLYGFSDLEVELPNGKKTPKWRDYHGKILSSDLSGLELDFNGEKIKSKLLGKFNAYNLLAVWSACKLLGFDMKKVKNILENIKPPRGRFDHFTSPKGVWIILDYSNTPESRKSIFTAVKEIKSKNGRVISISGCGGDRDPSKRPKMGKIAAQMSDIAIFTSDNPRSEEPDEIIKAMKEDLIHDESKKVIAIVDRSLAIKQALELAKEGDVILCMGKGHEDYQVIKGKKIHFDEREEFQKAFH